MSAIGIDIDHAVKLLREGEIVGIPTETVYGLAANALDSNAVAKIFAAKERPAFDPLIVHIGHLSQLDQVAKDVPDSVKSMLEELWPGPLTVVLPRQSIIPDITVSGHEKVAVRMPSQPLALELLRNLDFPLAAPSANPFGYISPTSAVHVTAQLGGRIPYVLDGGNCEVGIESTIIEPMGVDCNVLRLGGLELEKLTPYFNNFNRMLNKSSNPSAPGQLAKHYSPKKDITVFERKNQMPVSNNATYILFDSSIEGLPEKNQLMLSRKSDLNEAASNVFSFLRKADEMEGNKIFALKLPEVGLGLAINDRLHRAAAK